MKKLYSIGLSALLMFGMGTATMAISLETSGEFDFSYNNHHWTGEKASDTWAEVGIKNHISINEVVSGDINLWYGTIVNRDFEDISGNHSKVKYIDAAYVTVKLGPNSLKIGCDSYPQDGSLNVLGDFTKGLVGDLKPAAVHLLGTMPIDKFTVEAGYFSNVGGGYFSELNGDGRNSVVLKGKYAANKIDAGLTCIIPGKGKWDEANPAMEYILNAGYKLNDKYKVYAAFIGADQFIDGNTLYGKPSVDQTDNFGIIGGQASLGKLWLALEYAVITPSEAENGEWVEQRDGTWPESNWATDHPYGIKLSYWFGHNTTLEYTRVANTGNYNDKDKLCLKVKF